MKLLFFIFYFLSTLLIASETFTKESVDINRSNGFTVYKKGTQERVSGVLKEYYDANQTRLKSILPLKNGQIEGEYQSFYASGKKRTVMVYHKSKREGKHTIFYENGVKMYESTLHNDKKDGNQSEWFKNGQLKYNVLYKNNRVEGRATLYSKDGKVESINEYHQGKIVKQIQPKKPNNKKFQTRALTTYGTGSKIFYLFISPTCPHCKNFLKEIEKYKDDVTFYIYYIPSNPKNKTERKILDIVYSQKKFGGKIEAIFAQRDGKLDLAQKVKDEDLYINNSEIAKAQQMQIEAGVYTVPTLVDTDGFFYTPKEFASKIASDASKK